MRALNTQLVSHSPEETLAIGREIAQQISPPCLILLEGELGTGKTTLTKGIVSGLGAANEEEVTSPSFALVHEYGTERKVYHVDLYRIDSPAELPSLGLEELIGENAIALVEWGNKLGDNVLSPQLRVSLKHLGGNDRHITIEWL